MQEENEKLKAGSEWPQPACPVQSKTKNLRRCDFVGGAERVRIVEVVQAGVRPSSGAATFASSEASDFSNTLVDSGPAAPGDADLFRKKKVPDTHFFSRHSRSVDWSCTRMRTMDRPGLVGPAEPTFRRPSQSFADGAGDGVLSSHRLAGWQRAAEPEQRPCGLAEAGAGWPGAPAADGPAQPKGASAGTL